MVQGLAGSTTTLNHYWPMAFITPTRELNATGLEMKELAPSS